MPRLATLPESYFGSGGDKEARRRIPILTAHGSWLGSWEVGNRHAIERSLLPLSARVVLYSATVLRAQVARCLFWCRGPGLGQALRETGRRWAVRSLHAVVWVGG